MTAAGPRSFIVTSQGVSATRWIAFALASNPKVFAAHGHFAIDSVVGGEFAQADDTGSLSRGNEARALYEKNDLDGIFAAYRAVHPGAEAYGNVHSYTLDSLQAPLKKVARASKFAIANVVRHPVSFVDGHFSLVRKAEAYPALYPNYEALFSQVVGAFHELFLVDCPDMREFLAFAVSCHGALIVAHDLGYTGFEHYRMESLTRDGAALSAFCEKLTGLGYSRAALDGLIAAGAINRHRTQAASIDEHEIYDRWPAWKQDIAAVMLSADALKRFEKLGYDVGMLRARAGEAASGGGRVACLADALKAIGHPLSALLAADPATPHAAEPGPPQPLLLESMLGYNIVQLGDQFFALSQSLGEVHVTDGAAVLIARHGDKHVIVTGTVEEARTRIQEACG